MSPSHLSAHPRGAVLRCLSLSLLVLSPVSLLGSCATVAETGRTQLVMFSDAEMEKLALSAYAEETGKYKEVRGNAQAAMVQSVGHRIAKASGREYAWEFKLLDAPDTVNAFALPGGKIAVYTGLLKVAPDADSLAAVIGHEIAHATSNHGNERMSQKAVVGLSLGAVQTAMAGWKKGSDDTKGLILAGLGIASNTGVLLPYSRLHESEADEIGLRFLVRAGYDPHAAPKLWERMAELSPDRGPAFLSTHPDPAERAQRLRELIPKIVAEEKPR